MKDFRCDPRAVQDPPVRKRTIKNDNDDLGLGIAKRRRPVDDPEFEDENLHRFMFGDEDDLEKVMEETYDI